MSKVKVYEYMVGMQGTFVNMANGHRAQPGQYVAYGDYLILLAERNGLQETADMRLEQMQAHIKRIAVVNRENDLLKAKIDELNQRWPNYHVDALIKAEAEIDRLKKQVKDLEASIDTWQDESMELAHENELLIQAGDAMAREIRILGPVDDKEKKAIEAWNEAKEGKQS